MKPSLTINFSDFWHGFKKDDNYFYHLLTKHWDVEISDTPDVLFYSCYGPDYLRFNCIRIFYSGENLRPDFTGCDIAMTFDFLDDHRHLRLPLYSLYVNELKEPSSLTRIKSREEALAAWQAKTKFCCTVVSNPASIKRNDFFHALLKHARVDSGGRYCNNVGGPVEDKLAFIKEYKFVLAFENSSYPGYTTEKIIQPMLVDSTPVYWGNPRIAEDFNTKRFINYFDYASEKQLIELLLSLEHDTQAAVDRLMEPIFPENEFPASIRDEHVLAFLKTIVSRRGSMVPVANRYTRWVHAYKRKSHIVRFEAQRVINKVWSGK